MNALLNATDLAAWANTRQSQGTLPALVKRLILGTIDRSAIQRMDFPAEDSVFRPGVDGILRVTQGNAFVNAGQSVWEMGVTGDGLPMTEELAVDVVFAAEFSLGGGAAEDMQDGLGLEVGVEGASCAGHK